MTRLATETLTLKELLLACAGATVPCTVCPACVDHPSVTVTCKDKRMFFFPDSVRLPCPCLAAYDGINHYLDATGGYRCCKVTLYDAGKETQDCRCCRGRGWVPKLDTYAWRQALRDKGYMLGLQDERGGTWVTIRGGYMVEIIVESRDGFRGQRAEMEATRRLLEKVPGVEMPDA